MPACLKGLFPSGIIAADTDAAAAVEVFEFLGQYGGKEVWCTGQSLQWQPILTLRTDPGGTRSPSPHVCLEVHVAAGATLPLSLCPPK